MGFSSITLLQFTAEPAGEISHKVGEYLAKLQARRLIVSRALRA